MALLIFPKVAPKFKEILYILFSEVFTCNSVSLDVSVRSKVGTNKQGTDGQPKILGLAEDSAMSYHSSFSLL